ncbi:MAG: hypothetical protein ACPGQS_09605, partial [Bradymonadia bacterium]
MFGLFDYRNYMVVGAFSLTLIVLGCGGSGPGPLPMRPDAGATDAGVDQFSIVTPANNSVITADDDLDSDLSNGIQIAVRVAAVDIESGNVALVVGDLPAEEAPIVDGTASFQISLPGDANGQYRLEASAADADGNSIASTTDVFVQVDSCQLTVNPRPNTSGCAFGLDADENDELDGIQVRFDITANCPQLSARANGGEVVELALEDGGVVYETTLVDGTNTLTFELQLGDSEPVVETLSFESRTNPGVIEFVDLNEGRLNRFLLADGERDEGTTYWTLSGQTSGVETSTELTVTFDPPIGDDELSTTVRADSTFRLEVDLQDGDFYEGTMLVTGQDACGGNISSAVVPVRFDAVTPVLSIVNPLDSSLLTAVD